MLTFFSQQFQQNQPTNKAIFFCGLISILLYLFIGYGLERQQFVLLFGSYSILFFCYVYVCKFFIPQR